VKEIAFLGGKEVGAKCLQHLVDMAPDLECRVTAVLPTPRGSSVKQIADQHELPVISHLAEVPECDVLISVQYHEILRLQDIRKARTIAVNLHMAPLPEYRGCNQFSLAIINGDTEFGVTIHQLTEGIDAGPIVAERRFEISDHIWVNELVDIATSESLELFRDAIGPIVQETFELVDQSELIPERGTSLNFRKDIVQLKRLDLSWDGEKLERYVRALSMPGFEPPHAILASGDKIYFHRPD